MPSSSSIPMLEEEEIHGISQLPEDVLVRILSLLPTKEAARAKLVSKSWRNLFEFLQSFSFDLPYRWGDKNSNDKMSSLMDAIDSALRLHKHLTLDKLQLLLNLKVIGSRSTSLIESWIDAALERKVKDLDLSFDYTCSHLDKCYLLPVKIFSARTITALSLSDCRLEIWEDIDLPVLRKLSLIKIEPEDFKLKEGMELEDPQHAIQKLISSCPSIQDLRLSYCEYLNSLHVSGHFNLQRLTVLGCYGLRRIGIDAPSLQYFHYSLREAYLPCDIVFTSSSNEFLKELILSDHYDLSITEDFLQSLANRFPNLEDLDVLSGLQRIEISHHRLKRLHLCSTKTAAMLKIDTPNLRSLRYTGYEMPLISSVVSLNTSSLQKVDIKLLSFNLWRQLSVLQSEELDETIRHCQDMKFRLLIQSKMHLAIPGKLRTILSPPVYDIKHLSLSVDTCSRYPFIIDRLLWLCHPQTLSISRTTAPTFLKVLYNRFRNKEKHPECCSSCTIKCWRHYLEDVQIDGDESRAVIDKIMTMPKLSGRHIGCKIRFILKWRSSLL